MDDNITPPSGTLLFEEYGRATKNNDADLRMKGMELLSRYDEANANIADVVNSLRSELRDDVNGYYDWNRHAMLTVIVESVEDLHEKIEKLASRVEIKK